jgi:hypothetical protein
MFSIKKIIAYFKKYWQGYVVFLMFGILVYMFNLGGLIASIIAMVIHAIDGIMKFEMPSAVGRLYTGSEGLIDDHGPNKKIGPKDDLRTIPSRNENAKLVSSKIISLFLKIAFILTVLIFIGIEVYNYYLTITNK